MNKSRAQKAHAKRRLLERYGLTLSEKEIQSLIAQIHNNQAKFISRRSLRVATFDVVIYVGFPEQKTLRVVYDKIRKNIVTALPLAKS
jgi:hypothetical protein